MNVKREFYDKNLGTQEQIKKCLQNSHLSIMKDDGAPLYTNDYTRCQSYKKYDVFADWMEETALSISNY